MLKRSIKQSLSLDNSGALNYNITMSYIDREQSILNILKDTPEVDVKTLTKLLFASPATVRRDLVKLERKGLIIRAHGKAISASVYADKNTGFLLREGTASLVKKKIAQAAVDECIKNGDVVILDASSTALQAISQVAQTRKDNIIITSGIKAAALLAQTDIKFYSTGGKAINSSFSFVGQTAINTLKAFNADVCLVSCHGISQNGFATDTSEAENDVRKTIMQQSKRKVLLIDSSKINNGFYHNLCHISEFDDVFCDAPLPAELMNKIKNFHLV